MRNMGMLLLAMGHAASVAGAVSDPVYGQRSDDFCRDIAEKIKTSWTNENGDLGICLERMRQQVLSDRVAFYFNVQACKENGTLVLQGEVERPEFQRIAHGVFRHLGYASIADRIEVVPDQQQMPQPFAVAIEPHVLTWSTPELKGIPMDEALFGEPVYILKELPDVILIKTFTGYWGFARKSGFRKVDKAEFIQRVNQPKAMVIRDYQAGVFRLPNGCRLPVRDWGKGKKCILLGPAGESIEVPKELCLRGQREKDMLALVEYARSFLNAPYQLGGKNSHTGIDCSGLIQLSYRTIGLTLPRDAKQQYLGGNLILPCVREALLPGDVIYFMSATGQVEHTGLYIGNREMIHAIPGNVIIQSMDPTAPNYSKRFDSDFIGAKRFWW